MGKELEKAIETVKRGVKDELEAALNYTRLAGRQGDWQLRKSMVNYAIQELEHAHRLIEILETLDQPIGDLDPQVEENDDLLIALIEYLAKEESAIFYYDVLNKLSDDEQAKKFTEEIQQEERKHQVYIQEVLNRIKTGEYKYE